MNPEAAPTVLVVDDEEIVCMFVLAALQQRGYRVLSANRGEAGLRCFSDNQAEISLVISDVVMPDISGYKMVEGIRNIRPDIPVLFITGTMQELPGWARETCCVLRKPFTLNILMCGVEECLASRRKSRRAE